MKCYVYASDILEMCIKMKMYLIFIEVQLCLSKYEEAGEWGRGDRQYLHLHKKNKSMKFVVITSVRDKSFQNNKKIISNNTKCLEVNKK